MRLQCSHDPSESDCGSCRKRAQSGRASSTGSSDEGRCDTASIRTNGGGRAGCPRHHAARHPKSRAIDFRVTDRVGKSVVPCRLRMSSLRCEFPSRPTPSNRDLDARLHLLGHDTGISGGLFGVHKPNHAPGQPLHRSPSGEGSEHGIDVCLRSGDQWGKNEIAGV